MPGRAALRPGTPPATSPLRPGPDLGHGPLGRQRQLLVPPRVHAGPEPRRPVRHERVRPLDVRPVVLAAGHRTSSTDRSTTRTTTRPASSTSRRPGSTRPTRSASRSRSRARRTSRSAWSSSTTRPIVNGVGLPEGHAAAEDLPLPHPERGQRPLLQLPVVRGRPDARATARARSRSSRPSWPRPRPTRSSSRRRTRSVSPAGPDWIQIGTEGGFLPAPAVVDGQQPTTWITDPTRFDCRQRRQALAAAGAGRAGRRDRRLLEVRRQDPDPVQRRACRLPGARARPTTTTPARPDLSPAGAPTILPGYGPNTRTVMQVNDRRRRSGAGRSTCAKLQTAFSHKADGSGVFESGQHPIIVGQAAYNSAYGTNFAAGSNCNPARTQPTRVQAVTASCASTTPPRSASTRSRHPTTKTIDAAAAEGASTTR